MTEPKIRFMRDDGSNYPEWIAGKLGDITDKVDRKAPTGSVAPIMMVSQGNGFIYQADKYSRENAGQSLKNYTLLKQGEFAYNHGASKAKPYGVAYCLKEEHEARVPFVYHTFRITKGINSYWHEALNTSRMDRKLKRIVSSGARMDGLLNIKYDTYMDVDVSIPCEEEQQKIADFLSSIDEVIAASEQEVANLGTQKKAVMKKIFSREVRFKKEDGTEFSQWQDMEFGELIKEYRDKTTIEDEDILLSCAINGMFLNSELFDHQRGSSNIGYLKIKKGTLILSAQNLHLGNANVNMRFEHGIISPAYKTYDIVGCLPEFMMHWVKREDTKKFFYDATTVGASQCRRNIEWDTLYGQTIGIPCLEEQRLIADFFSDFEEAIAAAKKELELWKELKKGLLQQMFV